MSNIKREADRCLKCKKAMCSEHCPVHTPVPQVMSEFMDGNIMGAGQILFRNNPMSAITSIVCPHERNCSGHCVLGRKGEPVEFFRVEQYISSFYLDTMELPKIEKKGKKVAIAGAGPSGITMALVLALNGYDVTMFEAEGDIGGVLRYGIPGFRLSKDILDAYKNLLHKLDVKIRLNVRIGHGIDEDDLFLDGYSALFMSIGVGSPNKLGLLGETLGNTHYAINYLKTPKTYHLGKKVVVIGAGNVAIDAARTAIRRNHASVVLLNRNAEDEMTASDLEVEMAKLDGVEMIHNVQAVRITEDRVCCVGVNKVTKDDGTSTYEEDFGEKFDIPTDSVILAIGQGPGAELHYGDMDLTNRGLIKVNEFGETSRKGVWAAGDIVTGASTVVEAVGSTLNTAKYLLERLDNMTDDDTVWK